MSKKLDKFIEEAVKNIRKDREITQELLSDLIGIAAQGDHQHKEVSLAAAKYVETLQRSNEQIVKLTNLLQKREEAANKDDMEDLDQDALFDLLDESDKENE